MPVPVRQNKKKIKRVSQKQEQRIATELGGRCQPASGAFAGMKGDIRVPDRYRVEAKYTTSKSYKLNKQDLIKIAGECEGAEKPVLVVEFMDKYTFASRATYVVLRLKDWNHLDTLVEAVDDAIINR